MAMVIYDKSMGNGLMTDFKSWRKKAKDAFDIREISKADAFLFVSKYHYLGSKDFLSMFQYGLFIKGQEIMVGVATFATPAGVNALNGWFGLKSNNTIEIQELTRLCVIPELNGAKKYGKVSNERRAMCYDASQKTHNSGTDLASPYIWMNNGWYIDSPFFARATASVRLNDSSCIGLNPTVGTGGQGYYVFIDINGSNSPNVAGEDLFFFIINEKSQLVPLGMEKPYAQISGTNSHGTCNRKAAKGLSPGMYCAARIMSDGWRMKY